MISNPLVIVRRVAISLAVLVAIGVTAAGSAQARVFIGIGVPLFYPGVYPAPYYYPPPVYYAPPPVVYAPPQQSYIPQPNQTAAGAGQSCYAGPYTCPMDRPVASGGSCYCLGNGGERVAGRAN